MLDNYYEDKFGVVHQKNIDPIKYDIKYVEDRYVSYGDLCEKMSMIRLSFLLGAIGVTPGNILDIGYGNGSFLDVCWKFGIKTYGHDVSNFPINGVHLLLTEEDIFKKQFDVVCMFDSMEHLKDPEYFIKNLKTNYIYVSVPFYKPELGDEWFLTWKHRRENEHLHHYSFAGLLKLFKNYNYELVSCSNVEDLIRHDKDNYPNILNAIFDWRLN